MTASMIRPARRGGSQGKRCVAAGDECRHAKRKSSATPDGHSPPGRRRPVDSRGRSRRREVWRFRRAARDWTPGAEARTRDELEGRHIAAFRQRDDDRIRRAIGVVLAKFVPQAPRVDAHDWVAGAIEIRLLAVELVCEHRLLEGLSTAVQRFFDHKAQKGAEAFRAREHFTRQHVLELRANQGIRYLVLRLWPQSAFRTHASLPGRVYPARRGCIP